MSCNNEHRNSFMSLKAINESCRALLARALQSMVVAHKNKYRRQMMAMLLAGDVKSWQRYYQLLVAVPLSKWATNDVNATERVN